MNDKHFNRTYLPIESYKHLPDCCGSVGWASFSTVKGRWLLLLVGALTRGRQIDHCFSPSLSPSLPLSLKINK